MGQFQRPSYKSDPLMRANLYRERAADCRLRSQSEDLGTTIRDSYRQVARTYEQLAEEIEGDIAAKRARSDRAPLLT